MKRNQIQASLLAASLMLAAGAAHATNDNKNDNSCNGLPTNQQLRTALISVVGTVSQSAAANGGLGYPMWATVVNKYGTVCAVAASTDDIPGKIWLGSRVISAQKANTANAFSTDLLALSTANLYAAVQPGGSLFGLQESNPVDVRVAYRGDSTKYGTRNDPMVGLKPGGINVFGGGLALYSAKTVRIGAVGVSGDTSCADHNIAWRLRTALAADSSLSIINGVPAGVGPGNSDNINYAPSGSAPTGFQQPLCGFGEGSVTLPALTE